MVRSNGQERYAAFISYSHNDEAQARWLHKHLEQFKSQSPDDRADRHPLRPVFRDRDELPASSDLTVSVIRALERSDALIVVCSPAAAKSRWVNEEIEMFRSLGKSGRIFCWLVDGEPTTTGLDAAFPSALIAGDAAAEPLAADARSFGSERNRSLMRLVAGLLDLDYDAIYQRFIRQRRMQMAATISGAVALTALILIGGGITLQSTQRAALEGRQTTATRFTKDLGEIRSDMRSDPERALSALNELDFSIIDKDIDLHDAEMYALDILISNPIQSSIQHRSPIVSAQTDPANGWLWVVTEGRLFRHNLYTMSPDIDISLPAIKTRSVHPVPAARGVIIRGEARSVFVDKDLRITSMPGIGGTKTIVTSTHADAAVFQGEAGQWRICTDLSNGQAACGRIEMPGSSDDLVKITFGSNDRLLATIQNRRQRDDDIQIAVFDFSGRARQITTASALAQSAFGMQGGIESLSAFVLDGHGIVLSRGQNIALVDDALRTVSSLDISELGDGRYCVFGAQGAARHVIQISLMRCRGAPSVPDWEMLFGLGWSPLLNEYVELQDVSSIASEGNGTGYLLVDVSADGVGIARAFNPFRPSSSYMRRWRAHTRREGGAVEAFGPHPTEHEFEFVTYGSDRRVVRWNALQGNGWLVHASDLASAPLNEGFSLAAQPFPISLTKDFAGTSEGDLPGLRDCRYGTSGSIEASTVSWKRGSFRHGFRVEDGAGTLALTVINRKPDTDLAQAGPHSAETPNENDLQIAVDDSGFELQLMQGGKVIASRRNQEPVSPTKLEWHATSEDVACASVARTVLACGRRDEREIQLYTEPGGLIARAESISPDGSLALIWTGDMEFSAPIILDLKEMKEAVRFRTPDFQYVTCQDADWERGRILMGSNLYIQEIQLPGGGPRDWLRTVRTLSTNYTGNLIE